MIVLKYFELNDNILENDKLLNSDILLNKL